MNPYKQKKVIYLVCSPLSSRDFKRFGISNWIKQNWEVKVFDLTSFLYPKLWEYVDGKKLSIDFEGLNIFKSLNEVLSAFNQLKSQVIFVDLLGYSKDEHKIRKNASIHGKVIKLELCEIPNAKTKKDIYRILSSLVNKPLIFFKKLIVFMTTKVEKMREILHFPDYLVVGGKKSMNFIKSKKISVIKAHNLDYDFLLQKEETKINTENNYLVFLDEDGPYHPDFVHMGIRPFVTAEKYYPIIDKGLEKLAGYLDLDIKIAAHPRSNYESKQTKYKHPMYKNQTFELIRDANLVVGHGSTALQWAVILKKPIILVTTDEIQKEFYAKNYSKLISNFAVELGKNVLNLDDIAKTNEFREYLYINKNKYENYVETYIKTKGSPEKLVWDIVIERIEQDLIL